MFLIWHTLYGLHYKAFIFYSTFRIVLSFKIWENLKQTSPGVTKRPYLLKKSTIYSPPAKFLMTPFAVANWAREHKFFVNPITIIDYTIHWLLT